MRQVGYEGRVHTRVGGATVVALGLVSILFPSSRSADASHGWSKKIHAHSDEPNEVWVAEAFADYAPLVRYATEDTTVKHRSWNYLAPPYHVFDFRGVGDSAATIKPGYVDWGDLGACNTPGETCMNGINYNFNSGHESLFNITYINNQITNFYTGTDSPGANEIDLWSVITHEAGHWIHLDDLIGGVDPDCPMTADDSSMCTQYNVNGTTKRRSPADSDAESVAQERSVCALEEGLCSPVPAELSPTGPDHDEAFMSSHLHASSTDPLLGVSAHAGCFGVVSRDGWGGVPTSDQAMESAGYRVTGLQRDVGPRAVQYSETVLGTTTAAYLVTRNLDGWFLSKIVRASSCARPDFSDLRLGPMTGPPLGLK